MKIEEEVIPEHNIDKTAFGDCRCGRRKAPRGREREICYYCEVVDVGGHCSRCGEVRGAWSGDGRLCRDCSSIEARNLEKQKEDNKT